MTRDEFLAVLNAYTADKTDDATLDFLHSATDFANSITDVENAVKAKDDEWREKYRNAFFNGVGNSDAPKATPRQRGLTISDIVTDRDTRYI